MSEENDADKGGQEFQAITSQADLDKVIGERLSRERSKFADYDALKAKAAKFDEADQASKSELQKATEALAAAEKERDGLRLEGIRAQVALAKGLTASQAKRLVGSTKEELEADADELIKDIGATKQPTPKKDPKSLKSGASGSAETTTGKERAADLLKQYRAASH